jgi:hypothetical protein
MAVPIIIVRNAYMKLRNLIIHKAVTKEKKITRGLWWMFSCSDRLLESSPFISVSFSTIVVTKKLHIEAQFSLPT